jgi:hypothetical protein
MASVTPGEMSFQQSDSSAISSTRVLYSPLKIECGDLPRNRKIKMDILDKIGAQVMCLDDACMYLELAPRTMYLHMEQGQGPEYHRTSGCGRFFLLPEINASVLGDRAGEFDLYVPLDLFNTKAAAQFLKCSESTLNHWRLNRLAKNSKPWGPKFLRIGLSHIMYLKKDLKEFAAQQKLALSAAT